MASETRLLVPIAEILYGYGVENWREALRLPLTLYAETRMPVGVDGLLPAEKPSSTPTDFYALPQDKGF